MYSTLFQDEKTCQPNQPVLCFGGGPDDPGVQDALHSLRAGVVEVGLRLTGTGRKWRWWCQHRMGRRRDEVGPRPHPALNKYDFSHAPIQAEKQFCEANDPLILLDAIWQTFPPPPHILCRDLLSSSPTLSLVARSLLFLFPVSLLLSRWRWPLYC